MSTELGTYELGIQEGIENMRRAAAWYIDHRHHVARLMDAEPDVAYAPSGSDAIRPELWRAPHWRWFFGKM